MKAISFLYSASQSTIPQTGILLENNCIATIDHQLVDAFTSENSKEIISNKIADSVVWWWPPGDEFREIHGIPSVAIMAVLKKFGFSFESHVSLKHKQVEDNQDVLMNYMEITINIDDEFYPYLVSNYGNVKIK